MRHSDTWLSRLLACLVLLTLAACNLTAGDGTTPTPPGGGLPIITITSPREGDTVPVNQAVNISATASDATGITRVQLFANGQLIQTFSSQSPGGDQVLPVVIPFTPTALGSVTLQVIAFRSSVASEPAEIRITVGNAPTGTTPPTSTRAPIVVTQPPVVDPFDPTCRLLTNAALNLRTGPGTEYPRILVLNPGTVVPITGRTPTNTWWQVRVGVTTGWVSNQFVTLYGNCSNVAVPPIPPTPTPPGGLPTWTPIPTQTPTQLIPTATFTATPGLPNLVIPSIVGATTLTLGAGNTPVTSNYSITVTNTGGRITGQFNNTIAVSPGGSVQPLSVIAGLGPGEIIVLTRDLTFSAPGSYTLTVRTDADSQVTEISEFDNTALYTVTVNAAP